MTIAHDAEVRYDEAQARAIRDPTWENLAAVDRARRAVRFAREAEIQQTHAEGSSRASEENR